MPGPFEWDQQPEAAGPLTEPRTSGSGPALDWQALAQHQVRLPQLDPGARARGEYVPLSGPNPYLPDPEQVARDRDAAALRADTGRDGLRALIQGSARASGADQMTARRTADAVLALVPEPAAAEPEPEHVQAAAAEPEPPAEPEPAAAAPAPEEQPA